MANRCQRARGAQPDMGPAFADKAERALNAIGAALQEMVAEQKKTNLLLAIQNEYLDALRKKK